MQNVTSQATVPRHQPSYSQIMIGRFQYNSQHNISVPVPFSEGERLDPYWVAPGALFRIPYIRKNVVLVVTGIMGGDFASLKNPYCLGSFGICQAVGVFCGFFNRLLPMAKQRKITKTPTSNVMLPTQANLLRNRWVVKSEVEKNQARWPPEPIVRNVVIYNPYKWPKNK